MSHPERVTKQRYRCPDDDGTAAHLALDVEQGEDLAQSRAFFDRFRQVRCLCGRDLTLVGIAPIPSDVVLHRRVMRDERGEP